MLAAEIDGHRAHDGVQRGLGGTIGVEPADGVLLDGPDDARQRHDLALLRRRHMPDEGFRHLHRADHVDAEHLLPVCEIRAAELAESDAFPGEIAAAHRAGRVDQDVDRQRRTALVQLRGECIDGGVVRDVERFDADPRAGLQRERREFGGFRGVTRGGDHLPAIGSVLANHLEPEPASRAGDQDCRHKLLSIHRIERAL